MNPLEKVMQDINKKYKTELIQKGTEMVYVDKIPFSSPRANYMTYGGIPIGKSTEIIGPENGGKTTTAIDAVGNAQKKAYREWKEQTTEMKAQLEELLEKNNKSDQKKIKNLQDELETLETNGPRKVVYVDSENTLDVDWAELNGVDTEELILIRPQDHTAEQVLQIILDLIESGQVIMLVLDSVPALVSQKLYDKTLEDKAYAGISDALTEFSRKVSPLISKKKTALVSINQMRENMKNPFDIYHTPGGKAWKHLHALRLYVAKGSFIDDDNKELNKKAEEPAGNIVDMTIVKTKVCKPDRRVGFYTLKYHTGIDVLADTVDLAIKFDIIVQSGSWFNIIDPETGEIMKNGEDELKFQGRAAMLEYLRDNVDLFDDLYEAINEKVTA